MKKYSKNLCIFIFTFLMVSVFHVFIFSPTLVCAQFDTSIKVNDDSTEYDQLLRNSYTQVAIKNNTVYSVWHDARSGGEGGEIYYAKGTISSSGELSFGQNLRISDGTHTVGATKVSGPSIAVDEDGTVYVVWTYSRQDFAGLYLSRSIDGGESFLPEQMISDRSYPKVATADGYVYIMCGNNFDGLAIYTSQDKGQTFADPVEVADGAGPSRIAAAGDHVYLAKSHSNDVYATISSDHGQTFSDWKIINDDGANTNLHWKPSIAADGKNVYLAWHDRREPIFSIYMAISNNNGITFGPNLRLSPPAEVDYNPYFDLPSVSAFGDHVAVSFVAGNYKEIEGSVNKFILVKVSHDAGTTWSDEMVVAQPDINPPSIGPTSVAINDQAACAVWQADSLYFGGDNTGVNVYSSCYKFTIEDDDAGDDDTGDDNCASVISELESLQEDYSKVMSDYEELQSQFEEFLEQYNEIQTENDELSKKNLELLSQIEENQPKGIPGFPLISILMGILLVSFLIRLNHNKPV